MKITGTLIGLGAVGILAFFVLLFSTTWNNTYYTYEGVEKVNQEEYTEFSQSISKYLPELIGTKGSSISYKEGVLKYTFIEVKTTIPELILSTTDHHKNIEMQMLEAGIITISLLLICIGLAIL